MGEYLQIIWDAETPSAKAVKWDNAMIIGKPGSSGITESTILSMDADDWQTILSNAGFANTDQTYLSVSDFFAADPIPGSDLIVAVYASGAEINYENTPLKKVTSYIWETPIKPPSGWVGTEQVKYFPNADESGNYINKADGSVGMPFVIEKDFSDNWTGRLNFSSGLSGAEIDIPPRMGCKITASFTVNPGVSPISDALKNFDINLLALSLPNTANKTDYENADCIFGSQLLDLATVTNMIAGSDAIFFWAFPGNSKPTGVIAGTSPAIKWGDLRSFIGQKEEFAPLKARPAQNDASLNDDMACGYIGMVAGRHPHEPLTFAIPHMAILEESDGIDRSFWKEGHVATIMKWRQLSGNPYLITYGFTFGVGYASRINYVRCKNIISKTLYNGLYALLASNKVKMSYAGMQIFKDKVRSIFKTLEDQRIVDGFAYVKVPIEVDLKNNTAAGKAARAAMEIPSCEAGFYWFSHLERIVITSIKNEA